MALPVGIKAGAELERIEIDLLLDGIYRHYGLDFRGYALASLKRRLARRMREEGAETLSALQDKVLHDPAAMERLLVALSISVTAMFRDPTFYKAFREKVVPLLRTYPFIRLWNAGCATGEETMSLAIVLEEEGLLDRTRIYATDFNAAVVDRARQAEFPLARMRSYTENYLKAGGAREFSRYYTAEGPVARFSKDLIQNMVFAQHNLVSDGSFNEFHGILCRNVLIYFGNPLQRRVHELFHDSLVNFGVLGLGHKETIRFTPLEHCYEAIDSREKLYRRVA
ncbi:MAG TPA: protein-glutamate O-methyltransferase CheR [Thermoleophilaceae bacterium]